jgi:glycosyltransferase involved in cell wall biosynthesis
VPDEDLPALYTLAEVFAFPSLYEGFGLPVLEAMACGAPVICSNASSLPEVAGEAAIQIAPLEVREWTQALERIRSDAALRASLRERGLRQAKRFTWEATARQTYAIYQEVYAPIVLDARTATDHFRHRALRRESGEALCSVCHPISIWCCCAIRRQKRSA